MQQIIKNCNYCNKEYVFRAIKQTCCSKHCSYRIRYERLKSQPEKLKEVYARRNELQRLRYAKLHPNKRPHGPKENQFFGKGWAKQIFKNFGININQYENMLNEQGGVCAICKKTGKKRLAVDHDHKTGKIRGLLCTRCNIGIGLLQDDPLLLQSAISYLTKICVRETIPQGNTK